MAIRLVFSHLNFWANPTILASWIMQGTLKISLGVELWLKWTHPEMEEFVDKIVLDILIIFQNYAGQSVVMFVFSHLKLLVKPTMHAPLIIHSPMKISHGVAMHPKCMAGKMEEFVHQIAH